MEVNACGYLRGDSFHRVFSLYYTCFSPKKQGLFYEHAEPAAECFRCLIRGAEQQSSWLLAPLIAMVGHEAHTCATDGLGYVNNSLSQRAG